MNYDKGFTIVEFLGVIKPSNSRSSNWPDETTEVDRKLKIEQCKKTANFIMQTTKGNPQPERKKGGPGVRIEDCIVGNP